MKSWLGKLFNRGCTKLKNIPAKVPDTKTATEVAKKSATTIETKIAPTARLNTESLGRQLSYGKWYYGIDTNAEPVVRRFTGGIEKRYPCKDGGEVIVKLVSRSDKSSRLDITKVGNPNDRGRGDWYRHFYSETAVKHYTDRFGHDATKTVKHKGATKQVLSTKNGKLTDDVNVPLKRWEITEDSTLNSGQRIDSQINSWNPNDFDRFCD